MRALPTILIVSVAVLLAGCASVFDGSTQAVRLATPGTYDAECTLDNGVKYRIKTGQTLDIMRSHRNLVVDCYASGDRHQQIIVESTFNPWGIANVSNGVVPGTAYDHYAGGLYEYPDVIVVDFVGMTTQGFETPAYHNKDAPNPYNQQIENYVPGVPRLYGDEDQLKRGVQRREVIDSNPFATPDSVTPMPSATGAVTAPATTTETAPAVPAGKNAEELTRSANPAVFNR